MEACQRNAVVLFEFLLLKLCGGMVPAPVSSETLGTPAGKAAR